MLEYQLNLFNWGTIIHTKYVSKQTLKFFPKLLHEPVNQS